MLAPFYAASQSLNPWFPTGADVGFLYQFTIQQELWTVKYTLWNEKFPTQFTISQFSFSLCIKFYIALIALKTVKLFSLVVKI